MQQLPGAFSCSSWHEERGRGQTSALPQHGAEEGVLSPLLVGEDGCGGWGQRVTVPRGTATRWLVLLIPSGPPGAGKQSEREREKKHARTPLPPSQPN